MKKTKEMTPTINGARRALRELRNEGLRETQMIDALRKLGFSEHQIMIARTTR